MNLKDKFLQTPDANKPELVTYVMTPAFGHHGTSVCWPQLRGAKAQGLSNPLILHLIGFITRAQLVGKE